MLISDRVRIPQDAIAAFCQRNHIRKLSLFGSVLRDDFRPDSDVDMLVEYDPEARTTLLDMAAQEIELSQMLGRKVDLRTAGDLSQYFRQKVVDNAQPIYARR
jgi:predicted nucleotidyltransferase